MLITLLKSLLFFHTFSINVQFLEYILIVPIKLLILLRNTQYFLTHLPLQLNWAPNILSYSSQPIKPFLNSQRQPPIKLSIMILTLIPNRRCLLIKLMYKLAIYIIKFRLHLCLTNSIFIKLLTLLDIDKWYSWRRFYKWCNHLLGISSLHVEEEMFAWGRNWCFFIWDSNCLCYNRFDLFDLSGLFWCSN